MIKWHNQKAIFGPIPKEEIINKNYVLNHFFTVPKSKGRVRPILNLSDTSIFNYSINDQIKANNEEWSTVNYIQQCEIIEFIHALGIGAWIWCVDLKWGYNNVPIHKDHVRFLAFEFDGKYWCYQVLPMGATSGPFLFTDFMEFTKFAIKSSNPQIFYITLDPNEIQVELFRDQADIHIIDNDQVQLALMDNYLDDMFGGHKDKDIAFQQLQWVGSQLSLLTFSAQKDKKKGPSQSIDLLGKNYNTITQIVKLTDDKYKKYQESISDLKHRQTATKRYFLKVIGRLRFAGTIYRIFNAFIRGIERYAHSVRKLYHKIDITHDIRRHLDTVSVMLKFAHDHGTPFNAFRHRLNSNSNFDITIYTDASGSIGIGGICSNGYYFQNRWSDIDVYKFNNRDIQWKELVAIYAILETAKDTFRDKTIHIFTDNISAKWMLINFRSKLSRPDCQVIINRIATICYHYYIQIWMDHIKGKENIFADALSRYIEVDWKKSPCPLSTKVDTTNAVHNAGNLAAPYTIDPSELDHEDDDP